LKVWRSNGIQVRLTLKVKQRISDVMGDNGREAAEFGRREGMKVPPKQHKM